MATVAPKFKVKADLAIYKAIQRNGRLSEKAIGKAANISSTTVHYAVTRLRKREFFEIKAVPKLEKFSEIPSAIIGFSNVHPVKIKELEEKCAGMPEVVHFFHSENDVELFVMDSSAEALTKKLFAIMELMHDKPSIYMTSPVVSKYNSSIPDKILDNVYGELPDRQTHA